MKDALLLSIEGNCSVNTVLELLVNGACVTTTTTVFTFHININYRKTGMF